MSHFTLLNTKLYSFQNLLKSLEKVTENLASFDNKKNSKEEFNLTDLSYGTSYFNIPSHYCLIFNANSVNYTIIKNDDIFSEEKNFQISSIMSTITQNYAIESILVESNNLGFEPLLYNTNLDGSKTLVLERSYKY